jgi:hypothetical protein
MSREHLQPVIFASIATNGFNLNNLHR